MDLETGSWFSKSSIPRIMSSSSTAAMATGWTEVGAVSAVLCTFGVLVYYFYPVWRLRHIPAPPYTWFLGHLPLLTKHEARIWTMLAKDYGPIYRFHIGRQMVVMVTDAELCREAGIKLFKKLPNRSIAPTIEGSSVLKDGLLFSRDDQWSGMRSIMQPFFHSDKMLNYMPIMNRLIGEVVDRLSASKEGEEINIHDIFQRLTLDIIGESAFGVEWGLVSERPGSDDWLVKTIVQSIDALRMDIGTGVPFSTIIGTFFPILQKPFRLFLRLIPGTAEWVADSSDNALRAKLKQVQEQRETLMKEKGSVQRVDSLSLLLESTKVSKANKKLLSQRYISSLTYELTLSASETSSVTLSFMVYQLARHPDVERKLLAEIDAFGFPDRCITIEDLDTKFPYLDKVFKETMRMNTTTPVITRVASQAVQLGGYHLPKGTWVWMAVEAVLLDPKNYPEPETFRPERFDENCEENKTRHPYAFTPFGFGPRSCIGKKFAAQQVKLAAIRIYQNFTFSLSPLTKIPLETKFGIVVRPKHGVFVRVHERGTRL